MSRVRLDRLLEAGARALEVVHARVRHAEIDPGGRQLRRGLGHLRQQRDRGRVLLLLQQAHGLLEIGADVAARLHALADDEAAGGGRSGALAGLRIA